MAWEEVDSNKATDKQIKYAETLLESYYGDINLPIYTMTKQEISALIDDVKKKCNEKKIRLDGNTEEVRHGETAEDRMPSIETAVRSGRRIYPRIDIQMTAIRTAEQSIERLHNDFVERIRREGEFSATNDDFIRATQFNLLWRDLRTVEYANYESLEQRTASLVEEIKERMIHKIADIAMSRDYTMERDRSLYGINTSQIYYDEYATRRPNTFFGRS